MTTALYATINFRKFGHDFQVPIHIAIILLIVLFARLFLHRALRRFVKRLLSGSIAANRKMAREIAERRAQRAETVASLLTSFGNFVIAAIAIIMILAEVNVKLAPLIAGAGIAGAAFAFGAQQLVRDILAGISMLAEDQFGIGDTIDVVDLTGTVEDIGLRSTQIRADDGTLWFVPNGEIKRLGNKSAAPA